MKNFHQKNKGFSTLELSIVLIIFGMVMGAVLTTLSFYNKQKSVTDTAEAFDVSTSAVVTFQGNNGRYPCPAAPQAARGTANYGREQVNGAGNCITGNGVVVASTPGLDQDGNGIDDRVFIGALPFATMLDPDNNPLTDDGVQEVPLTDKSSYDGYNQKLTYAVSENLTRITTYNDSYGAINVVDENSNTLVREREDDNNNGVLDAGEDDNNNGILDAAQFAHFVIVSHGENGRGSYTSNGTQVDFCPPTLPVAIAPQVATSVNEIENCDGDSRFLSGLKQDRDHSLNDDTTKFAINQTSGLWTFVQGATDRIRNTNPGNVGMGTNFPRERLEVNGDLRSQGTQAISYCDTAGANCLPPAVLGGTVGAMQCPPGQIIVSIEQNRVNCAAFTAPARTCPAGCFASGISNITGTICRNSVTNAICP